MQDKLKQDLENDVLYKINNSAKIILGMNSFLKLRFQNVGDERTLFCFNIMHDAVEDLQEFIKTLYSINNKVPAEESPILIEDIQNVLKS